MGIFLSLLLLISISYGEVLYVAAAASFRPVLERIVPIFEREKGVKVKLSFSSSGNLYRQILGGAPLEVFISANEIYPELLVKRGYAARKTLTEFARGRLALFSLKIKIKGFDDLLKARRVAIANPRHAPYGKAAVEVLKRSGFYEKVKGKLVYGANVGQAFQFVISGGADFGIVALSLVRAYGRGDYWVVPSELHPPIKHVAVATLKGKDRKAVKEFLLFLKDKRVKDVLEDLGFEVR